MPNIQLAIQGGGAKICALVAALEAFEEYHDSGKLIVTRVAGTSAGAIAGCMFASKTSMGVYKERLRSLGRKKVKALFPRPGKWGVATKLLASRPVWKQKSLERLLREVFGDLAELSLDDLKNQRGIDVRVVAANLSETRLETYEGKKRVLNALLDSCGLPYLFRVWSKSGHSVIVDGGICENLPSSELEPFSSKDGPIVGVSFKKSPTRPIQTGRDFSMALLETAIENSMERARGRLQGSILDLDTKITTFDFDAAFDYGLEEGYKYVGSQSKQFLSDFVERLELEGNEKGPEAASGSVAGDPWRTQSIQVMEELGRVHKAHSSPCVFDRCDMVLTANSLRDDHNGQKDLLVNETTFHTSEMPVLCRSISLARFDPSVNLGKVASWTIHDFEKGMIGANVVPMRFSNSPEQPRLLIIFNPVLPAKSGPYRMKVQQYCENSLEDLMNEGSDEIVYTVGNAVGSVRRMNLVAVLPNSMKGKVKMVAQQGSANPGSKMTAQELRDFSVPPDCFALGWTGSDLPNEIAFGVDIVKSG